MGNKITTDAGGARNNLKEWEENRKWLQASGYMSELNAVVSELNVLKLAVLGLDTTDNYEQEGMASLIDTIASKLHDMAHGRTKDMLLPK